MNRHWVEEKLILTETPHKSLDPDVDFSIKTEGITGKAPSFSETLFMALQVARKGILVFPRAVNVYKQTSLLIREDNKKKEHFYKKIHSLNTGRNSCIISICLTGVHNLTKFFCQIDILQGNMVSQNSGTLNMDHMAYKKYTVLHKLTLWRRNYIFLILEHSVYKMWKIQEPNKLALWNKLHFEEKNAEYRECLKYSIPIFVE